MNGLAKQDGIVRHILVMIFLRHPLLFLAALGLCVVLFSKLFCCGEDSLPSGSSGDMFSSHCGIYDVKNGSIETLSAVLKEFPFTFVMFYSPWCGQSRKLVPEFLKVARDLNGKVKFVAVNCWIGSCRQSHVLDSFPKLLAYHTIYDGVEYLGPHIKWSMIGFLKDVIRPFVHIGNEKDKELILHTKETWVLGYFNFSVEEPKSYSVFFKTALNALGKLSRPLFGVVTNEVMASSVGITSPGQLLFHQPLHQPQLYPTDANFTSTSILAWVKMAKFQFVTRLTLDITQTETLAQQLNRTAALILFLPLQNTAISKPLLTMYRSLAIQYNNCSCNTSSSLKGRSNRTVDTDDDRVIKKTPRGECLWQRTKQVCVCLKRPNNKRKSICSLCYYCAKGCSPICGNLSVQKYMYRKHLQTKFVTSSAGCITLFSTQYYTGDFKTSLCCSVDSDASHNSTVNLVADLSQFGYERVDQNFEKLVDGLLNTLWNTLQKSLAEGGIITEKDKKLVKEIQQIGKNVKGITQQPTAKSLDKDRSCNNKVVQLTENDNKTCQTVSCTCRGKVIKFGGAGCYSNRSVSFFYMDSGQYWRVAENLGIQKTKKKNKAALVIVDVKNDAQYIHDEAKPITNRSAVQFVMKFMDGNLTRRLRSAPVPSDVCLYYHMKNMPCIVEVVGDTFQHIVLDESKDVMLMYYAPWCSYCKSVAPVYLALAKYFKNSPNIVFARLDGDSNDLTWEYSVQKYPTFIFYPAQWKDRSVRFPDSAKRTLSNLVTFMLRHATVDSTSGKEFTEEHGRKLLQKISDLQDKLTEANIRQKILESQIKEAVRAKQSAIHLKIQAQKLSRKLQQEKQKERSIRIATELLNKELERKTGLGHQQLLSATKSSENYQKQVSSMKNDLYYAKLIIDAKTKELANTINDKSKLHSALTKAFKTNNELNDMKTILEAQIETLQNNIQEEKIKVSINEEENKLIKARNMELHNQIETWHLQMEIVRKQKAILEEKLELSEQSAERALEQLFIKEEEGKNAKEIASISTAKLQRAQEDFVKLSKKLEDMEIKTKQS